MNTIEFKTFELKASSMSGNTVIGYGAAYGNEDKMGDIIVKGAFDKTIKENGMNVKMVVQHNLKQPIGKITKLESDEYGLKFEAKVSDTDLGREYLTLMKDGAVDKFSIGYKIVRMKKRGAGRDLLEIKLYEISPVTIPMNDKAMLLEVKSEDETREDIQDRFHHLAKLVGSGMASKGLELQMEAEVLKLADEYKSATQPSDELTEPVVDPPKTDFLTELNLELIKQL